MTGQDMKARREALHLTQEQLAESFGVTPATVSQWELGASQINAPGMTHLALLALETLGDLDKHAPALERLQTEATARLSALDATLSRFA